MAEISPQFAGRPIQLADHSTELLLPDHGLRLVVPGDKPAAGSVRDVVRIDIE